MKVGDMVRVKDEAGPNWGGHYGYISRPLGPYGHYFEVNMLNGITRYWPTHLLDNITEQADAVQDR